MAITAKKGRLIILARAARCPVFNTQDKVLAALDPRQREWNWTGGDSGISAAFAVM